jgi:Flp pilus assembly protein TadD
VTDRPTFAEAHYNLGVAVFMSGRPADAVAHMRDSVRLNPNDPQPHEFLVMLIQELGAPDPSPQKP